MPHILQTRSMHIGILTSTLFDDDTWLGGNRHKIGQLVHGSGVSFIDLLDQFICRCIQSVCPSTVLNNNGNRMWAHIAAVSFPSIKQLTLRHL